jgi:hypothetical protein
MTIDTRQQLLTTINAQIKLNGTGAITGPILNNILDTMVNSSLFNTGAWSPYTSYAPLDIVSDQGVSYIAIIANVNQEPPNSTYWTVFASTGGGGGGGAQGGGATAANPTYTDGMFYVNGVTVQTNVTIPTGDNAGTFGPVTIASGVTVTVPSGSYWSIV